MADRSTRRHVPAIRLPRSLAIVLAVLLSTAVSAAPALAQDGAADENRDQIVVTGRLEVAADEVVDVALIFDGPAVIDGTVNETLVVFNGDTEISGTVREDVVVFNGDVVVRSGAEVGGDLVTQTPPDVEEGATVGGRRTSLASIDVDAFGFWSRIAWWIGYSISSLVLGLLLLAFAPSLATRVREVVAARLGASIGWGVGLWFLLPIGAAILLVTVVGLPLGIFTLLALAFIYTVGYVVAAIAVGGLVMRTSLNRFVVFLVGWGILRVVGLIPFVAGWVWFLASIWGLGLLAVAIRRGTTEVPAATLPPMPPAPVAAP